jgi:hypothetical protein
MAIVPVTQTAITTAITNDTQYLRSFIDWAKQRYEAYNLMCTTQTMTAAGISSTDQAYILAFIGDLNRIIQLSGGTVPSNADDMLYNITQLLGLS